MLSSVIGACSSGPPDPSPTTAPLTAQQAQIQGGLAPPPPPGHTSADFANVTLVHKTQTEFEEALKERIAPEAQKAFDDVDDARVAKLRAIAPRSAQ
jgi:hypothetical protein